MIPDPSEEARRRRAAAAAVSRDFAVADDLATLLSVAELGFGVLFGGGSTIQLGVGADAEFVTKGTRVPRERLAAEVAKGLAGTTSTDAVTPRPGILLVPQSATTACRAWIQFERPRPVSADQMIVADLLAQAFALAVDRLVGDDRAARREDELRRGLAGHEVIGQAVGMLVERHRIHPEEAFDRLRSSSQRRNVKLREIAARVVETGREPDEA